VKTELDLVDELGSGCPALNELLVLERAASDDERDAWLEARVIARYLARIAERPTASDELHSVLAHLELVLERNPSEWATSWVEVGILETVQNIVSNERLAGDRLSGAAAIRDQLGPRSLSLWRDLDEFWKNSVDDI
jgi:hypothetical protein